MHKDSCSINRKNVKSFVTIAHTIFLQSFQKLISNNLRTLSIGKLRYGVRYMECSFMSTIGMINSHEGEVMYITVIYSLDTCMLVTYA